MHTNEPRELEGVELGYDPRDIDAPKIYKVVAGIFIFALVFFGGGAIVYTYYGGGIQFARDGRKPEIVGPKVQGNISAKVDIMEMRQKERSDMETYGTNEEIVNGRKIERRRIPLDQAMKLLAERGLPVVTSDQKATSPGTTIPQNATGMAGGGPAPSSTETTPAQTPPVPTPDAGQGATGSTGGAVGP